MLHLFSRDSVLKTLHIDNGILTSKECSDCASKGLDWYKIIAIVVASKSPEVVQQALDVVREQPGVEDYFYFYFYIYIYIYICLSACSLCKTVHTLCKSYLVGPLCIVVWNTGCCLEHRFEESNTLSSLPFARYGWQRQFSWRQLGRLQQLKPCVYSYQTQEAQLKPDCGTEGRIGSRKTSGYTFHFYYFFILYM